MLWNGKTLAFIFQSLDDKAIIPVGNPDQPVSTGVRSHHGGIVCNDNKIVALDHDFHVAPTGYRSNSTFWGSENIEFFRATEILGEPLSEKALHVPGICLFVLKVLYIDASWYENYFISIIMMIIFQFLLK